MFVRKRLDIGWLDLAFGMASCFAGGSEERLQKRAAWAFDGRGRSLACLSVRSGLDLSLSALNFPAGSEVLVGAVNIPHMFQIFEAHGLVPVPVDVQPDTMGPAVKDLEQARTDNTVAVLIPHLFGGRQNLDAAISWAHGHGLFFFEDCAQAFDGAGFRGHRDADVSLFSFGTIKFASAMGGALLRFQNTRLKDRVAELQTQWPRQPRRVFFLKCFKYSLMKAISGRLVLGAVARLFRLLGRDYDQWANALARGFPGDGWIQGIRQRPCVPLLRLLERRLRQDHRGDFAARRKRVREAVDILAEAWPLPGRGNRPDHGWLFPLLHREPDDLALALRRLGFDATQGQSLICLNAPEGRTPPERAAAILGDHVLLPLYPELPEKALHRLVGFLLSWAP